MRFGIHHSSWVDGPLLTAAATAAQASDLETPRFRTNHLAFPVDWNGKQIMIETRLQVPLNTPDKVPAVILLHGTPGIRYSGVYYAAALNRAGVAMAAVFRVGRPRARG